MNEGCGFIAALVVVDIMLLVYFSVMIWAIIRFVEAYT